MLLSFKVTTNSCSCYAHNLIILNTHRRDQQRSAKCDQHGDDVESVKYSRIADEYEFLLLLLFTREGRSAAAAQVNNVHS